MRGEKRRGGKEEGGEGEGGGREGVERGGGVRKKCSVRKESVCQCKCFVFFFEGGNEKKCVSKKKVSVNARV